MASAAPSTSPAATSARPSPLPSPTPAPIIDVGEEVLAAYQAYWGAILAASDPPDRFSPGLREHATGAAFDALFETIQASQVANQAVRLPEGSVYRHEAEVESIEADRATVRDCAVDDALVVQLETGEVLDDDVVSRQSVATLVREDGVWKVSDSRVEQSWEGVAGCAA